MIGLACLREFFMYVIAAETVYQSRTERSLRGLLHSVAAVVVVVVVAQINLIFLAVHLIAYQVYFGIRTHPVSTGF